jgi:hypothetical protein
VHPISVIDYNTQCKYIWQIIKAFLN